jgi:hypothetical protein
LNRRRPTATSSRVCTRHAVQSPSGPGASRSLHRMQNMPFLWADSAVSKRSPVDPHAHTVPVRRLFLAFLLAALVAGCGGGTTTVTVTQTLTESVTTTPAKKTARLFFMRDGKVGPVARQLVAVDRASLLAAVAAGPTADERAIGFTQGEATERTAEEVYTLSQFDPSKPVDVGGQSYTRKDFEHLTPAILV